MDQGSEVRRRRRGDRLEAEILDAAWQVLTEVGWAGLRMEAVAARAATGKTSVYSRWPTKATLVRAAARRAAATRPNPYVTGDLRADLRHHLEHIAAALEGPYGEAMRGLAAEARSARTRGDEADLFSPAVPIRSVLDILEGARRRGHLTDAPVSTRVVNLGPTLVAHHYLMEGCAPGDQALTEVLAIWLDAIHGAQRPAG